MFLCSGVNVRKLHAFYTYNWVGVVVGTFLISTQHFLLCVESCILVMRETLCLMGFLAGHENTLAPQNREFRNAGGCPLKQPLINA